MMQRRHPMIVMSMHELQVCTQSLLPWGIKTKYRRHQWLPGDKFPLHWLLLPLSCPSLRGRGSLSAQPPWWKTHPRCGSHCSHSSSFMLPFPVVTSMPLAQQWNWHSSQLICTKVCFVKRTFSPQSYYNLQIFWEWNSLTLKSVLSLSSVWKTEGGGKCRSGKRAWICTQTSANLLVWLC